jgi:hypothetical protein
MQVERRQNPYPFTWEIPVGILATAALLLVLGVHLGRGLANWFAGANWHWPQPTALFTSLPAVLGGDADAGLDGALPSAASASDVLGWVVAAEVFVVVVLVAAAVYALRRWGPGRLKGMATAAQAEAALGLSRLRRVRRVIRPDLYSTNRAAPRPVDKEESS